MLYLYLGYLCTQLYSTYTVIAKTPMSVTALIFSVSVFLIWGFVPVIGYVFAKMINAKGRASSIFMLGFGLFAGILENALFYFDILTNDEVFLGLVLVGIMFFIIAYIKVPPLTNAIENRFDVAR